MTEQPKFRDEDLTAYLDGEANRALAAEIQSALKTDPALGRRLEDLSFDKNLVSGAFQTALEQAPEMPELPETPSRAEPLASVTPRFRYSRIAAVAAIALVAGWVAGYFTPQDPGRHWHDFVAAYHALYVTETLAQVEQERENARTELDAVAAALGRPVDLLLLEKLEGLNYKRAQILGFEGKTLMQLTFLTDHGVPIALCVIRSQDAGARGLHFAEMLDMHAAHWSADGFDYLLIGGRDSDLIETTAQSLHKQI